MNKFLSRLLWVVGLMASAALAQPPSAPTFYNGIYYDSGSTVPGGCSNPAIFYNTSNSQVYVCGKDNIYHQTVTADSSGNVSITGNVAIDAALLAGTLTQGTYYVDCNGSDSNNGRSPSAPFATIAKVNTLTLTAGQSVMFKRGCEFRGALTIGNSGAAAAPITFGVYGQGAEPIINGSVLVSSWTSETVTPYNSWVSQGLGPTPAAAYFAEDTVGGTALADSSGNANTLTLQSGTFAHSTDHRQGAYSFSSSGSGYGYLACSSLSSNFPGKASVATTGFTVMFWAKLTSVTSGNLMQFTNGSTIGFGFYVAGGTLVGEIGEAAALHQPTIGTVSAGTWFHVALREQPSSASNHFDTWLNGVKTDGTNMANPMGVCTSQQFQVGNYAGLYDEVVVVPAALSDAQIQAVANGGQYTGYYSTLSTTPTQVFDNSNRMQPMAANALVPGAWYYDSGATTLHIRTYDDDSAANETIEAAVASPITVTGSHVAIQDLRATKSIDHGVHMPDIGTNLADVTVQRVIADRNFRDGIRFGPQSNTIAGLILQDNLTQYNGADGLRVVGGTHTGVVLRRNKSYFDAQLTDTIPGGHIDHAFTGGIVLFGNLVGLVVEDNEAAYVGPLPWTLATINQANNKGVGIWLDTVTNSGWATAARVCGNLAHHNWSNGIYSEKDQYIEFCNNTTHDNANPLASVGNTIYIANLEVNANSGTNGSNIRVRNNTVYGSGWAGVSIGVGAPSTLTNVVFSGNVIAPTSGSYRTIWTNLTTSSITLENNCYTSSITPWFDLNGTQYSTLQTWAFAGNFDTTSLSAVPGFNNATAGDLTLQPNSPCYGWGAQPQGRGAWFPRPPAFFTGR